MACGGDDNNDSGGNSGGNNGGASSGTGGSGSGGSTAGGDTGSGNDGGNGNDGEPIQHVNHNYYSLDFAPSGDFRSTHVVSVPHNSTEGEIKVGNSTVSYRYDAVVGNPEFTGYNHLFLDWLCVHGGRPFLKQHVWAY